MSPCGYSIQIGDATEHSTGVLFDREVCTDHAGFAMVSGPGIDEGLLLVGAWCNTSNSRGLHEWGGWKMGVACAIQVARQSLMRCAHRRDWGALVHYSLGRVGLQIVAEGPALQGSVVH